ncbi:MAG TPA: hypothetical protein VFN74_06040 [Chloroflexota bacterium]|nr:hypothetical protein [Chloroflexota bacterium]
MAMNAVRYRLLSARGIALPLALVAGALAALPFVSGLPALSGSRAPAAAQPTPGIQRHTQEVYVTNSARGCRWQHSPDPAVQIADCGDENESVRVVFKDGRATEYRVMARQDPNKTPAAAQTSQAMSAVLGAVSSQPNQPNQASQPSQPGRILPNSGSTNTTGSGAPLRVTPNAGG